jgi:hypothetical protein
LSNWVPYVIRTGDHLAKIAAKMRFDPDAVWASEENADLRARRPDPNMLCAGDILYVPKPETPVWQKVTLGSVNKFVVSVPTVKITLTLAQNGQPIANATCKVHGLPGDPERTTDGAGKLEFDAPASLEFVTLEFESLSLVRRMRIGHLDPVETDSGIAQRLRNLGFLGRTDGAPGTLGRAITAFQRANGLPATGLIDAATRSKLSGQHGC